MAGVGTAGKYLFAWVLGVGAVVAPWVAIDQVPIDVNDWASIYVAGAIGGLALEMLLGRGRLELPGPSVADPDEVAGDNRRPFGPLMDLGFLARISSAGIASVALLLVYYALTGDADTAAEFDALASDPSTFGWAVFLGVSSPAIWTLAQRMVEARIAAAEATHNAKLEQLNAALTADRNAALTSANSSLTSTIGAAAAELRAAEGLGMAGTAVPVADAIAVAPVVDAGAVITDIEAIVGEAADATPGEVDVEALSLALFEKLPVAVAGLTGPPAADAGSSVGPEAAADGTPVDTEALPAAPAAATTRSFVPESPVARALQILQDGTAGA